MRIMNKILGTAVRKIFGFSRDTFDSVIALHEEKTNWNLTYPVVSIEENKKAEAAINRDIESFIANLRERFDSGFYYTAKGSFEVHSEDATRLSLSLKLFGLPYGANGNHTYTVSLVYDKETGERVPLERYVRVTVSDIELYRGIHTFLWDGTGKSYESTFKKPIPYIPTNYFLPGDGAVCLVFQPYSLAAGANGSLYIRLEPEYVDYLNRKNQNI